MENNEKKGFINIQLFAENQEGAETPNNAGEPNAEQQIDYRAKYEEALLEIEKQKKVKDQYATENANYKKKEIEKMTDEEKKANELKELIDSKNKMEAELNQMRLEKDLLANGFTAEESEKLIKGNFAVKDIADIIKARLEASEKSIRAELIKNSTPTQPMGSGNTNTTTQGSYAEKLAKSQFEGSDKLQKIKDLYKN